ncbi:transposase, IS481 family [Bordetella pertussis H921]|nr:transposase, IS481 family [Bordetella pertussis H921]
MNTHKHARLTFLRRLEMVQQLIAHQVCVPEAARAYGVTAPTVRKWLGRFLAQGQAGLADASSRPTVSPRAIAPAKALAIVELRRKRLTQARIAQALGGVSQHRQPRPGPRRSVAPGRLERWCATSIRPPAICCTSTSRSWDVSSALATGSRATDAIPLRGRLGLRLRAMTTPAWPSPTSPRRALPQRRPVPQGRSGLLPAPGRDHPALAHRQWLGLSQPRLRRAVP